MKKLISIKDTVDIPQVYRDSPIERLLEYHNLSRPHDDYDKADLLIGMCMDHRKRLRIPDNFAYVLRSGGGNLLYSDFKVSYAIAVGGVSTIALIGHTDCGMVNLSARKAQFVEGLVSTAGWEAGKAEEHFNRYADKFEIGNEIDFVLSESERLRSSYPRVQVVPMLYRVEDNLLYLIKD